MTITSQDRNTALTIVVVLVVCTVSLIAVLSTLLQLLQPVFAGTGRLLGAFTLQVQAANQNFPIKLTRSTSASSQIASQQNRSQTTTNGVMSTTPKAVRRRITKTESQEVGKVVGIWRDVISKSGSGLTPASGITIPKIGFVSTIYAGSDAVGALKRGLWSQTMPSKDDSNIVWCERAAFAPNRANSCFFLVDLKIGDTISLTSGNLLTNYKIVGIGTHTTGTSNIYEKTDRPSLKIITNSPKSDNLRLVILADFQYLDYAD